MVVKRPVVDLPWHVPSDQPDRITDPVLKRTLRRSGWGEYLRTAALCAAAAPVVAARLPGVLTGFGPRLPAIRDLVGVAVDPRAAPVADQAALVRELGVRRLLLRAHVSQVDRIAELRRFADAFPDCEFLIVIVQDRAAVCDPARWRDACTRIVAAFQDRTREFQIGIAPNRTKWGCGHLGDYFLLAEGAMALRERWSDLILAGPSIIDFEPIVVMRAVLNLRRFRFDASTALLYVDRRGPPQATQYGWFDLRRKIAFQVAVNGCSPRLTVPGRRRLWLTETNWPLQGQGEHAPTSPRECVSEADAATYLRDYYRIAWETGAVERVYWWQLVARGYGLVDSTDGLRQRPAFTALRALIQGS